MPHPGTLSGHWSRLTSLVPSPLSDAVPRPSADDLREVMSAWALHERRFADLVQANEAILDAIDAHRAVLPDTRGLSALLSYARAQVEGRWDASAFPDDGAEVEDAARTITEGLRRDLAEDHPLAVALRAYEAVLAQAQATRSTARLVLGRVGNQHPEVVLAALPSLRPPGRSHLDVVIALASFAGDAGVLGVFDWLEAFWRSRRRGLPAGPERDTCNTVIDRVQSWGDHVRGAPRSAGGLEEAVAQAQDDLDENPKDLRAARRLAEALGAASRPTASLATWLWLLERMDNENDEASVCLAAAARADAAGLTEQAAELRRIVRCTNPPKQVDDLVWRLGVPAPYVRLRAYNAASRFHDPAVARALVGLLSRVPVGEEPWRRVYDRSLGYTIGTAQPTEAVAGALLEVELAEPNVQSWLMAAALNGDPRLRARGKALIAPLRQQLEALRDTEEGTRLERLIETWDAGEE